MMLQYGANMPPARRTLSLFCLSSLFLVPVNAATFESLYSFGNSPDGRLPTGALAVDKNGALSGTTESGGAFGRGTVFALRPPSSAGGSWSEEVLWSFGGTPTDGSVPLGGS